MSHPWLTYRCDRTWAELEGSGPSRRCDRCDREVIDLEALQEEERAALLGGRAPVCVRFLAAAMLATLASSPALAQESDPGEGQPPEEAPVRPGEGALPDLAPKQEVMGALDRTLIDEGLRPVSAELRRLYRERLEEKPRLQGKIVVRLVLAAGAVKSATVQSSTVGDDLFEEMVLQAVQQATFERLRAQGDHPLVVVSYPFLFKSADEDEPSP